MRVKFRLEILTDSPWAGASNKGEVGKTSYFLALYSSFMRQYLENGMLLLMTSRKLHMRFRLAPRSMTLDDLELL